MGEENSISIELLLSGDEGSGAVHDKRGGDHLHLDD
jgi:hypothetical protein